MIFQEPSVLARLPRPLEFTAGRSHLGNVYGVEGKRKRKRKGFEIASAVDGETVNIYDIQAPKLNRSYPVPPTTNFTCAPFSFRYRDQSGKLCRRTICASLNSRPEVRCFYDSPETAHPTIYKHEITDTKSPIVYLDILLDDGHTSEEEHIWDVVAVHEDGLVRVLSGDLSAERFVKSSHILDDSNEPSKILMASILSVQDEMQRSLKGRDDLLTKLQGHYSSGQADWSILLLVLSCPSNLGTGSANVKVKTLGIQHRGNNASNLLRQPHRFDELTNYTLPEGQKWSDKDNLRMVYYKSSSTLCIGCTDCFISYVSLFSSPRIDSRFENRERPFSSFQRLSPFTLLAATQEGVAAYDLKYKTVQHQITEARLSSSLRLNKDLGSPAAFVHFLTYFPKLNSVIAVVKQTLVSFEVVKPTTKLVDAIGQGRRGSQSLAIKQAKNTDAILSTIYGLPGITDPMTWASEQSLLDNLIKDKDVDGFEDMMANVLSRSCSNQSAPRVITNLQLPTGHDVVDRSKVDFLLTRIFRKRPIDLGSPTYQPEDLPRINVIFLPPRLLKWLIEESYLTSASVGRAVFGTTMKATLPDLVTDALIESDQSFKWLIRYLRDSPTLDSVELLHAISLLLSRVKATLHEVHSLEKPLLHGGDEEMELDPGEVTVQTSPSSRTFHASSKSEASIALKIALKRSDSYSQGSLTALLGTRFSNDQVIDLIQYLREQLFLGGYTSHFRHQVSSALPSPPKSDTSQNDVTDEECSLDLLTTTRLLSCCLDNLGPLSFIGAQAKDNFVEKFIHQLRDEISAALGGVEEAKYLQGLLREVLRYGESASGSIKRKQSSRYHSLVNVKPEHQRPGTIVTLYATPPEDQGNKAMPAALLPLSLREDDLVSDFKIRKGGGQVSQRTFREKAYLERRKGVGKYSFERLVL